MKTPLEIAIAARCRELANGADPMENRCHGICRDVHLYCTSLLGYAAYGSKEVPPAYAILRRIFEEFGLDGDYPIGIAGEDAWVGEEGERRRALAGRVADYLEAQP